MKVHDLGVNNKIVLSNIPPVFKRDVEVTIKGNNNKIVFGEGVTGKKLTIDINGDDNRILIGKKCVVNGSLSAKSNRNMISIGKFTTIGDARIECEYETEIILGSDCMLSRDIVIRSGDSHSIIDINTGKRINHAKSVNIGDHVWIGYNANVGKGSVIKKNTIVGLGSYVNKAFSTGNVILAGVPAKIVKENVIWDRRSLSEVIPESHLESLKLNYLYSEEVNGD
ncbi:acyltransferase [Type-D symbiont of Plautia stali]|uniref:acyltransferase n=1 Tax=Type-D symbiont of Plautia stali TaxID=1560356 RepID=UPI00073F4E4E|nr:hypothetical protein [Type-D symbiont of Plautia stali]